MLSIVSLCCRCRSADRRWNHLLALTLSADSSIKASDYSLPAFHQEPTDPPNPPDPVSVTANHDTFCSTLPFTLCIQRHPQPQNGRKDRTSAKVGGKSEFWNCESFFYFLPFVEVSARMHLDSYFLFSDGPGEKRLISTVWSPHLVSFLTQTSADLTGPSSGPWPGCTRRLTRAFKNISVLLLPCVEGCVAYHQKKEVRTDSCVFFNYSSQHEIVLLMIFSCINA